MDALISAELVSSTVNDEDIFAYFTHYEREADSAKSYPGLANVYTLNHTHEPVVVDEDLFALLQFALEMKEASEGYFNPFLGELSALWKKCLFNNDVNATSTSVSNSGAFTPYLPSDSQVSALLSAAETTSLVLDPLTRSVQRLGEGSIDLGGIAKGYALQKAVTMLKASSVQYYLINGGNSSIALGENITSAGTFSLGLQDLSAYFLQEKNVAIGTSGVMEQYVYIDSVLYSHIINPFTGSAKVTSYQTVHLLGQDSAVLDALSTAFLLMGPEKSVALETKYSLRATFYDGTTLVNHGVDLHAV